MPEQQPIAANFQPRRFRTTVPYYSRYRLGYPDRLIRRIAALAGLKPGDAVMDLGCGPGLLAVAFARLGMAVTAVDPEPEMLAAAGTAADEAGVRIDLRAGSSFDLPVDMAPFRLVTMGRVFHWTDREATLAALDKVVTADGAIAFFDDDHPRTVENAWRRALRDLEDKYGRVNADHIARAKVPGYRSRESLLLDSAFPVIEQAGVVVQRELTADDIVGLALSLSSSSPEKLGAQRDAFEADLRAMLHALSPGGRFTEIAELSGQIAFREGHE